MHSCDKTFQHVRTCTIIFALMALTLKFDILFKNLSRDMAFESEELLLLLLFMYGYHQ